MGSVPTGRKVIFTQPLPPLSQDGDGDDAYALDPLLALDLADTIVAGNDQGSTLKPDPRDEGTGNNETAAPPTVLDRLGGLMPSVAVVLQVIEDKVAADPRQQLADGGTAPSCSCAIQPTGSVGSSLPATQPAPLQRLHPASTIVPATF